MQRAFSALVEIDCELGNKLSSLEWQTCDMSALASRSSKYSGEASIFLMCSSSISGSKEVVLFSPRSYTDLTLELWKIEGKTSKSSSSSLKVKAEPWKATRCFHAWPLQDLSLRLISLARFRLIPSVSEGYIPRIPPRSSTRRTITKKKHHWVFQSRSRMKNPEAAAASQQLARYRRCLVLVQATALGNHSETVFLRQVCFLNKQDPGNWSQDLCPQ